MDRYTVLRPKVKSVALAPNPVAARGSVTVTAGVAEEEIEVYAQGFYAGQFYSGGFYIGQADAAAAHTWADMDGTTWDDWNNATWFTLLYGSF